MDRNRERGIHLMGDLLSEPLADGLRDHIGSDEFGKECGTWAADFAYGTVWSRDGLDRRMRSAAVMGMLIALRQTEELKVHVGIAIANGVTAREIEEILYLTVPYAGFPAANTAKVAIRDALGKIGGGDGAGRG